jgi:hypothetical protein
MAGFIRGHTLHRRVLLVLPGAFTSRPAADFYANNDISVHRNVGSTPPTVSPNTLADLTRRECRFAHDPATFPFSSNWGQLGLPTLAECSSASWTVGTLVAVPTPKTTLDFWSNRTSTVPASADLWPDNTLASGSRLSDDIILTNVIGFDVKAWDPTRGRYVDLGDLGTTYGPSTANSLGHYGDPRSSLAAASATAPRVYDTWSTTYFGANASNGLDDNNNGIVDDESEKASAPPYPIPLRGIQVKIRTFEPDSKQPREVTVVQDFLPQ